MFLPANLPALLPEPSRNPDLSTGNNFNPLSASTAERAATAEVEETKTHFFGHENSIRRAGILAQWSFKEHQLFSFLNSRLICEDREIAD